MPVVNLPDPVQEIAPVHAWAMSRQLTEIAIELTVYCNLSCVMCSVWRERSHGIATDLALQAIADARALGAMTLTPCGAETFMRRDAIGLLEQADAMGFTSINVVTNGLLLTPRKLDRLERLTSLHFNISIDGPREVHDALRGDRAYDRAVRVLENLRARRLSFGISTVLMRQTIGHVERILELAAAFGAEEVSLQPYQAEIGGPDNDHSSFCFAAADESWLRERLQQITAHAERLGIQIFTEDVMKHIPAYLARGVRPIPPGGCFVPSRFVLIDYRGDVYPCFFMRNRAIGNVTTSRLTALWHNEVQRSLNALALAERCPGCLAACSDIVTYKTLAT
jgi:MoaA/NifB/PqqE/SkfB family radical SAM enzyme